MPGCSAGSIPPALTRQLHFYGFGVNVKFYLEKSKISDRSQAYIPFECTASLGFIFSSV